MKCQDLHRKVMLAKVHPMGNKGSCFKQILFARSIMKFPDLYRNVFKVLEIFSNCHIPME